MIVVVVVVVIIIIVFLITKPQSQGCFGCERLSGALTHMRGFEPALKMDASGLCMKINIYI